MPKLMGEKNMLFKGWLSEPHNAMVCLSVGWLLAIICLCFTVPRWRGWVGGFVDWKRGTTRKVSFIWGKMRTVAWETAPQIALRDCSKEAVGEGQYMIFMKGEFSAIRHLLYKRFSASHLELMSSWRDLVLFWMWGEAKIRDPDISSWKYLTL